MATNKSVLLEINVDNNNFTFPKSISEAIIDANIELNVIDEYIRESIETIDKLTPNCDKYDYILSASSGVLCGIIDIFLVGKPGESPVGNITDKWFEDRVDDFANLVKHHKGDDDSPLPSIKYLEKIFKVPYDQSVGRKGFRDFIDLTPNNHHFKSLGHNPTLLGLFFSILDQFLNRSDFIDNGEFISLNNSEGKFELKGNNVVSKIVSGIINWFGHLTSDISGSSSSKGRGMGIPSPILSWSNDVIAIKRKLNIQSNEFDKSVNELAMKMFMEGYDVRFQTTQTIPVIINEMVVRFIYSFRRLVKYYKDTPKEIRNFTLLWQECEPFTNATVRRMLMVSHGTFCLVDASEATLYGFASGFEPFNIKEFFMRLNIIGIGRFAFSLYGEVGRKIKLGNEKANLQFIKKEKIILDDYISGLKALSIAYDDELLLNFIEDFQNSTMYKETFNKSIALAKLRNVSEEKIVKSKAEIDNYFRGGGSN